MEHRIPEVEQYIKENLCQPLNRLMLADVACLSPVHFHRRFKAETGFSPGLYIEMHKIKYSLELLKEAMQVQDIAFQLGFANYETFSRAFKRHCKIAPADLQSLLHRLAKETNPERPLLVSASPEPSDLQCLVADALERGIIVPSQLSELQVCIITPKDYSTRSRKVADKYKISFEAGLAGQLGRSMKL